QTHAAPRTSSSAPVYPSANGTMTENPLQPISAVAKLEGHELRCRNGPIITFFIDGRCRGGLRRVAQQCIPSPPGAHLLSPLASVRSERAPRPLRHCSEGAPTVVRRPEGAPTVVRRPSDRASTSSDPASGDVEAGFCVRVEAGFKMRSRKLQACFKLRRTL